MRKSEIIGLAIILSALLFFGIAYSVLPEEMFSYFDGDGDPIDTIPTSAFMLISAAVLGGIFAVFAVLSRIEKMRPRARRPRLYYGIGLIIMLLFYIACFGAVILWNLGIEINLFKVFVVGLGVIFFTAGTMVRNAKPGWFMGCRTPWTGRDERVWYKTHQFGGNLLCLIGLIQTIAGLFTVYAFFVIFATIFTLPLIFAYSYLEYRRIIKN